MNDPAVSSQTKRSFLCLLSLTRAHSPTPAYSLTSLSPHAGRSLHAQLIDLKVFISANQV